MDNCTDGIFIGTRASGLVIDPCATACRYVAEIPSDFKVECHIGLAGGNTILPSRR